jgi:hypothetical protein
MIVEKAPSRSALNGRIASSIGELIELANSKSNKLIKETMLATGRNPATGNTSNCCLYGMAAKDLSYML